MPRQARLDAPETLQHVMGRGIERRSSFLEEADRAAFGARLGEAGAWPVSASALRPHHAQLLVRTGQRPLPRSLRSLRTGYAGAVNRRPQRVGPLVQHRYTSIVVEAEPHRWDLGRDLPLNPLRATVVPALRPRARDPWTGHRALLARGPTPGRPARPARAGIAYLGTTVLGHPGRPLAPSSGSALRTSIAPLTTARPPHLRGIGCSQHAEHGKVP